MNESEQSGASDDPRGQQRQVTVLFAAVADFTPLAERLGEEDSFGLMRWVSAEMMGAVHRHGGTVQDFTGDGIMALFGDPAAPRAIAKPQMPSVSLYESSIDLSAIKLGRTCWPSLAKYIDSEDRRKIALSLIFSHHLNPTPIPRLLGPGGY